jgi:hypothetical protein
VSRRTAPPSGWQPPAEADLEGKPVALAPLAAEIADRYFADYPDDLERYGDAARAWEIHDTHYLLAWALGDVAGYVELERQVAWLARILEAREFPLDHLAGNLLLAASVVAARVAGGEPVAERLRAAARLVRETDSFL